MSKEPVETPSSNPDTVLAPEWFEAVDWSSLIQAELSNTGITLTIGYAAIILVLICYVGMLFFRHTLVGNRNDVEYEMAFGSLGKVSIKPNHQTIQVAHEAWVEISTRMAGVELDREHDLITDVYASFYSLFKELRRLTKSVPAQVLKTDTETITLVKTLVSIMNDGLRPHLTKWRVKYESWYEAEKAANGNDQPLAIQNRYPELEALLADLETLQSEMKKYASFLDELSHRTT